MALFNFDRLTGKLIPQMNGQQNGQQPTGDEPFKGITPAAMNPVAGMFGGIQGLAPLIQATPQQEEVQTARVFQEGAAAAPAPAPSEQAIMLQPQRPQPAFMNAVAQAGAQQPQGAQGQQGMPEFTDDQLRALAQMVARFMRI